MADLILRKEILDEIKKDASLFGKVMDCLGKKPSYGLQLLKNNDQKLTQASVLRILREHLGVTEDNQLLEEIKETAAA